MRASPWRGRSSCEAGWMHAPFAPASTPACSELLQGGAGIHIELVPHAVADGGGALRYVLQHLVDDRDALREAALRDFLHMLCRGGRGRDVRALLPDRRPLSSSHPRMRWRSRPRACCSAPAAAGWSGYCWRATSSRTKTRRRGRAKREAYPATSPAQPGPQTAKAS